MKEEFFKHVEISRIPVRVIMQLTYNCNFRCVHCYQTPLKQECSNYVTANEWKPFLKELRERGCMFLAFTGGELFSYPDFCTLYEFAYDLGYKITLTTNGSLINDVHMELFKKYKPEAVFITLYGMSELTYKEFTNTTGAYIG